MDSPPRSLSDRLNRRVGIVALVKYHLRVRTRTAFVRLGRRRRLYLIISGSYEANSQPQKRSPERRGRAAAVAAAGHKGSGERMGRRLRTPQWVGYGGIESEFVACN